MSRLWQDGNSVLVGVPCGHRFPVRALGGCDRSGIPFADVQDPSDGTTLSESEPQRSSSGADKPTNQLLTSEPKPFLLLFSAHP